MILLHQFLAKWKKHIKDSLLFWRLQNPPVSRMCKQSHGNCREILTLPLVKPWASVLSFAVVVWVWQASSGQGIKGRLGVSGTRGAVCSLGISRVGCGPCTCAESRPSLGTQAPRRSRAPGAGRDEREGAPCANIGGIPDEASASQIGTSLRFSGSDCPLLCNEKAQLDGL